MIWLKVLFFLQVLSFERKGRVFKWDFNEFFDKFLEIEKRRNISTKKRGVWNFFFFNSFLGKKLIRSFSNLRFKFSLQVLSERKEAFFEKINWYFWEKIIFLNFFLWHGVFEELLFFENWVPWTFSKTEFLKPGFFDEKLGLLSSFLVF